MIDEKIAPLVEALQNQEGISTFGSCQGHPKGLGLNGGNGYRVPYVMFKANDNVVDRLRTCLAETETSCAWSIEVFNADKNQFSLTVIFQPGFSLKNAWDDIPKLVSNICGN